MWNVPIIWPQGECWIIGGGPSLIEQFSIPAKVVTKVRNNQLPPSSFSPYLEAIHDKHIIGINSAFQLGNWIDVCFFGDRGWFFKNREDLAKFTGIKISCNPDVGEKYKMEDIKYLQRDRLRTKGISENRGHVAWNLNSGYASISLAVQLGVSRIILLGFDMQVNDKKNQHWHNLYRPEIEEGKRKANSYPFSRHLLGSEVIAKHAAKMKVEILNASPNSAIREFKKVTVKDVL